MTNDKVHVDSYAILPPTLSAEILDDDNLDPAYVILKMVNKINLLDAIQRWEKIDLTDEKNNDEAKDGEANSENEEKELANQDEGPHPMEEAFTRILFSLYHAMMKTKALELINLMVCAKSATTGWCEKQHKLCLQQQKRNRKMRVGHHHKILEVDKS